MIKPCNEYCYWGGNEHAITQDQEEKDGRTTRVCRYVLLLTELPTTYILSFGTLFAPHTAGIRHATHAIESTALSRGYLNRLDSAPYYISLRSAPLAAKTYIYRGVVNFITDVDSAKNNK
jgi:hypothetical protein